MTKRSLALSLCLAILMGVGCKEATKWISSYGFSPIQPPSTLLAPGALIMKKRFEKAGTRLICTAEDSLGPNFVPTNSKTITGKFTRSKKVGWHVGADVLSEIHVNTQSDAVADVYVQVDNARIVNLTDSDVLRAVNNRSAACQAAIARRKAAGYDISLVKTALIADVQYTVKFSKDANIEADVKLAQVQQVAVTLGGNISSLTENDATATDLVWGVQDSMFLAAIGTNDSDVKALRRKSILSPSDVLTPAANSVGLSPVLTSPSQETQEYIPEDGQLWCPAKSADGADDSAGAYPDEATTPEVPDIESLPLPEPQVEQAPVRPVSGARSPPSLRGRPAVGDGHH